MGVRRPSRHILKEVFRFYNHITPGRREQYNTNAIEH